MMPLDFAPGENNLRPGSDSIRRMRSDLEPVDPEEVRGWLLALAKTRMSGKPETREMLNAEIEDAIFACGDLPAVCWTEATLKMAKQSLEWWPGPAQIMRLLEPIARTLRSRLFDLDHPGPEPAPLAIPARESTIPYKLPPPPPNIGRPAGWKGNRRPEPQPGPSDGLPIDQATAQARETARAHIAEIAAKRAAPPIARPANDTGPRAIGELVRAIEGKPGP
jgi:hypothetical protein